MENLSHMLFSCAKINFELLYVTWMRYSGYFRLDHLGASYDAHTFMVLAPRIV
jgi:hypothetical protein